MLNSFNLFLSLLSFWAIFMFASNHISWLYAICGIFAAIFVMILSLRLEFIKKNSEMLYLSLGFHRHFIGLFLLNFLPAISLLFRLAFREKKIIPTSCTVTKSDSRLNLAALISTINMTNGLLVTNIKGSKISVHSVEDSCFSKFNFRKTKEALQNINDDNLV